MRDSLLRWKYLNIGEIVVSNLKEKKHDAYLLEKKEDVLNFLKSKLKENSLISFGGSISLEECGVIDFLSNGNYNLLNRNEAKNNEEKEHIFYESFKADYYFCSANAITMDGKIMQLDGNGTRVAPMIWGPKNVIIVSGMNKVVSDLKIAEDRINFISPMNAKRINAKTPCSRIGECIDCESKDRICVHRTILETGVRHPGRFIILLVAETLGL